MMDIFRPKISRDSRLKEEIRKLYYTTEEFLEHFEKYIKFVLDRTGDTEKKK